VLQRVEAVVGELGDFLAGSPDAEDAALFPRGVFWLVSPDMGCSTVDDGISLR
jgi:hypothetical protein